MLVVADANLLYWFLAANVTTGVFNFATDSLKFPGWLAVVVLVAKTFAAEAAANTSQADNETAAVDASRIRALDPPSLVTLRLRPFARLNRSATDS